MADESKQGDLDLGQEEAGFAFRAEMWLTDALLEWWKHILAVVVLGLLGILVYGQVRNMNQASQRATTSAIADVEAELPSSIGALAMARASGAESEDDAKITEQASRLLSIAQQASGTAKVEAALKAGELFRLTGDAASQRTALDVAASEATGVLRYAALSALATLDLEEGKTDDGLGRYRELQLEGDFLARRATLDLATALEAVDRAGEAVKVYDEFLAKWPTAAEIDEVNRRRAKASGGEG